uniref:ATP synthase F1 subunit epsilon n=1 Tax=Ornithodoros parkeri TaxID=140564 RepID=A6N9W8_ORNPR|nr:mitochondrial ATPase inhibitor [Ornithodoros parkeri]
MALRIGTRVLTGAAYRYLPASCSVRFSGSGSGEWGSGSGRGGGGGGSVREAGGAFGKMEAAREEEYFRKLTDSQVHKLREHLEDEIKHHERLVKQHEEEIERHKKKIRELKLKEHP